VLANDMFNFWYFWLIFQRETKAMNI